MNQLLKLKNNINHLLLQEKSVEQRLMLKLCLGAVKTGLQGNYPVASGITNGTDLGHLKLNKAFSPNFTSSRHAEMLTLDSYERIHGRGKNLHLVTTLEPCLMCTARIAIAGVTKVTYLIEDPTGGGTSKKFRYPHDFSQPLKKIKFVKFKADTHLLDIGNELYKLGEEIWAQNLK